MWFQGSVSCLTTGRGISSGDLGLGVLSTSEMIDGTMVTRRQSFGKGLYAGVVFLVSLLARCTTLDQYRMFHTNKYWTGLVTLVRLVVNSISDTP